MNDKILSIIVPTYNMEKYLGRCLASMIMDDNSMDMLEVLVINDGSKDKSSEIAHGFETKYPNTFHVIDKENGNYGSCINRGLKEAIGKYVKILDADDMLDNATKFISFLSKTDADLIISRRRLISPDGISEFDFPITTESVIPLYRIPTEDIQSIYMHHIAYRLEIVKRMSYHQTEGISYTDLEWSFYPISQVKTVSFFNKVVYVYDKTREGQTVQPVNHCKNMWMEIKVVSKMMESYKSILSSCTTESTQYLNRRLYGYILTLYQYFILLFPKFLDNNLLVELDAIVSEQAPDMKEELLQEREKRKLLPALFYVRLWDTHKKRLGLKFALFDMYTSIIGVLLKNKALRSIIQKGN